MVTFDTLRPEERDAFAALAALAFQNYEYFADYIPNDRRRERFLRTMLRIEFRLNADRAAFFTAKLDGQPAAVAMLCGPAYEKPSSGEYLRAGFWRCFLEGGFRDVSAWDDMERRAGEPCRELGGNAWTLSLLTVDPDDQGSGVGSRLLNECLLPYVSQQGGDRLCLFTNAQGNRKFYEKNGFEEFDERFFDYRGYRLGSWSYQRTIN